MADGAIPQAKVNGLVAALALSPSAPVLCKWTGAVWQTLAGGSIPTSTTLVRWYDSSDFATVDVTAPTHYNPLDKWFQEPGPDGVVGPTGPAGPPGPAALYFGTAPVITTAPYIWYQQDGSGNLIDIIFSNTV